MDTSTAARDLSTEASSLRIDRRRQAIPAHHLRWVGVLFLVAAGLAGWWWLIAARVVTVHTTTVTSSTPGEAEQTMLIASGYVTARRRATVSFRVTGKLHEVLVEAGMPVRAGQVLARLDDSVARAALSITDAQVTAARNDLGEIEVRLREAHTNQARQRQLIEAGIVAAAELDTINATVDATTARLAAAFSAVAVSEQQLALRRVELADTILRAPFDGIVISNDAQPGEMVSPTSAGGGFTRTGVCTIVDMSSLEIDVDVNEAHIGRIFSRQPVAVVLDAYPEHPIRGHVVTIVPTADRQKATVQVRIAVDPSTLSGSPRATSRGEQRDPHMLPDMTVKVSFVQAGAPNVGVEDQAALYVRPRLLVPRDAVRTHDGQDVVFVVRDGRTERRPVRLGTNEGDHVEVHSGLTAGDRIVIKGPNNLTDQTRVEEASVR